MDACFKLGDKVSYQGTIGTIVKKNVVTGDGSMGALVKWDDNNLIPPESRVPYTDLVFVVGNTVLPKGNQKDLEVEYGSSDTDIGATLEDFLSGDNNYYQLYDTDTDTETHCPVCNNTWKETWINGSSYYDCLTCNKKKEDIL